ncbi:MAG: hypothetical protein CYG59_11390, partial [Chloroflexi bacterium]
MNRVIVVVILTSFLGLATVPYRKGFVNSSSSHTAHGASLFEEGSALYLPLVTTSSRVTFAESFDGAPTTATSWRSNNWDIAVHSRDRDTWYTLEPINAHHDAACGPPSTTHMVTTYEDAVFQCNGHV